MSVIWQDLDDYAQKFSSDVSASDSAGEAEFRAATNRLYYSAFHCASFLADIVPDIPAPKRDSVHKALIQRYTEYPAMNIPKHGNKLYSQVLKMGLVLNGLRGLRVEADYHLDDDFDQSKFELCRSEYDRYREAVDEVARLVSDLSDLA